MKILMVGVQPYGIGGMPNYVRPLCHELTAAGHQVSLFFSGAWERKYNFLFLPYLKREKSQFPFEHTVLINSPCWILNGNCPDVDIRERLTEALFEKYLLEKRPDVVHFQGFTGLPGSLITIPSKYGIPVFITHHVYWILCQKQVMIDGQGKACSGPSNFWKCSICIEKDDIWKLKFRARIRKLPPTLLNFLVRAKQRMFSPKKVGKSGMIEGGAKEEGISFSEKLRERLEFLVVAMNDFTEMNICVSNDVKMTLMRFGVKEDKLLVQHIGSELAKTQKGRSRPARSPLVIGNIGGVGYYKGTQVLIDATEKIAGENFVVKIFGKYEPSFLEQITKGKDLSRVQFLGRYVPEDLPKILDEIDVMVLPSICNDTAPQTIFESYSAGIPIIASRIGGFPDFVQDGVNGRLFCPGDSEDLAAKITFLLENPRKILEFSAKIPRLKTISENATELVSLYQRKKD